MDLGPHASQVFHYEFKQRPEACRVTYRLTFQAGGAPLMRTEESPYLLTPVTPKAPRINGPEVVGARPGAGQEREVDQADGQRRQGPGDVDEGHVASGHTAPGHDERERT